MGIRAAVRELVRLDAWSPVDYKTPMKETAEATAKGYFAASWLSPKQARRLNAYMVLAAYEANTARVFIDKKDDPDAEENREYGDAALIIDQVLAALLGETQEIVVRGAEDYDPDLEQPGPVTETGADGNQTTTDPDDEAIERWQANLKAQALAETQEFLRDWADAVHLGLRLADCERNAVGLGDSVYLLGWDSKSQSVKPAVMDPGFYFPVLPDTIDTYEYPTKVHFAWELDGEDFTDGKTRLRRLTYEVRPIMWAEVLDAAGQVVELVPPDNATVGPDGVTLTKVYPWSDEPSTLACYLTDATWILDDTKDANDVDVLTFEKATFATDDDGNPIRDMDLMIDFLPIIHIPNTPAGGHHFGQSSLARVLQLMDDLQGVDTDAQRASATTGSPIIVFHGAKAPGDDAPRNRRSLDAERRGTTEDHAVELAPGSALFMGESGGATVVNTSEQLAELRNLVKDLRDRLSVNSRLPAAVLGTMKPSEAPSGYAIKLSFGPMDSMIRQMRLTRSVKYPLMLKMVQRICQVNTVDGAPGLPPGETVFAEMRFGSYLPSDQAGVLELVKSAREAKLISLETAIEMLVEVGFPVEDIAEEISKIQQRDFQGANDLADVLGDVDPVREYLGLDPLPEGQAVPVVPPPNLPTPPIPS